MTPSEMNILAEKIGELKGSLDSIRSGQKVIFQKLDDLTANKQLWMRVAAQHDANPAHWQGKAIQPEDDDKQVDEMFTKKGWRLPWPIVGRVAQTAVYLFLTVMGLRLVAHNPEVSAQKEAAKVAQTAIQTTKGAIEVTVQRAVAAAIEQMKQEDLNDQKGTVQP
jgi:hypothetical protein